MSKNKKIALIVFIFIFIITGFRVIWFTAQNKSDHPQAIDGVIDLRDFNMLEQKPIALNGEWEFFPDRILSPKVVNQLALEEKQMISVPGTWKDLLDLQYGYGTYRLKVLLDADVSEQYGLRIRFIPTTSHVFVNGELVAKNGQSGTNIEQHEAKFTPSTIRLEPDAYKEIDILIQVSNYDFYYSGGIVQPIKFGTELAIEKEVDLSISMQYLLTIVLLFHTIYALILAFLSPQKKVVIYFAIALLFTALSTLIDDDKLLLTWLSLSFDWSIKLLALSHIITTIALLQTIRYFIKENKKNQIVHWLIIIHICYGIFVIVMPLAYIIPTLSFLLVVEVFAYLKITGLACIATLKKDETNIYILLAAIALISNVVWGAIKSIGQYDLIFYPFDLIIVLILLSVYWFKVFIITYKEKEGLIKKLQKENERKDEFLAKTSHELRNPIHGVVNIAQGVLDREKHMIEQESKDNLKSLISIGQRTTLLLNDLIDVSRLKEHVIRLNKQSVSVHNVTSAVLDMIRFITKNKNIQLVNKIPKSFPNVFVDKNRFIQILFNLLHNAARYTHEGKIIVSANIKDNMAHIYVEDTGIGISEDIQKIIFRPYEQGDMTVEGGLGLGLSVCKDLVEMHDGTITVDSAIGEGSIFTFTLPLANDICVGETCDLDDTHRFEDYNVYSELASSTYVSVSDVPISISGTRRPNVLVVDDDSINLDVIVNILSEDQFDVVTVLNGKDALEQLKLKEWDLIIADVMMPQMSGYELTKTIRKQYSISELPILLLTARAQLEDIYTGFLSGANDYVTKPIHGLELKMRARVLTKLKQSISEQLSLEAAWLQAQIQPHFLYNTFDAIISLSEIDTDRMVMLLKEFGNYLQCSFDSGNLQRAVTLDHELELLRSYIYIEKERFGERLSVIWDVDDTIELFIPPLTIQPLVENAIRHGVLKRIKGGTVHIRIKEYDDYVEVMIQDDGVGMDEEKLYELYVSLSGEADGVGLANTNKRLKRIFGQGLTIQSAPDQGTTVSFRIPKNSI